MHASVIVYIMLIRSAHMYITSALHLPTYMSLSPVLDLVPFAMYIDLQPSCATTGDGLYEGLSWLHTKLTEKQVRKSVTKPISEVKESTTEKNGLISSWFSSVASYFTKSSVAVTA